MRVLIYKRTHTGDPDANGNFGIHNCMGQIRKYDFDVVIGVGGISKEPKMFGIDRKINWVGTGATKKTVNGKTIVNFEYFCLLEQEGPSFELIAPTLAERIYGKNTRFILKKYSVSEREEAKKLIETIKSKYRNKFVYQMNKNTHTGCVSKGCKKC